MIYAFIYVSGIVLYLKKKILSMVLNPLCILKVKHRITDNNNNQKDTEIILKIDFTIFT